MSYEVSPARRPGTVTAASYLLFVVAVVIVVDAIVGFVTVSKVKEATRAAYQSAGIADADQLANAVTIFAAIFGVIYILLAAGMVVLGILDMRGKNPARIVTWVVAGLGVLCFCWTGIGSLVSGSLTSGMGNTTSPNGVSATDLAKRIRDAEPSWLQPTQTTLALVSLLALILVIILLALPASNAYFRQAPVADPGIPQYPYPQQPPYPGQPPAGGEPPYPGQPSA